MLEPLRSLRDRFAPSPEEDPSEHSPVEPAFAPLRALAAHLLLVTAAEATLRSLADARRDRAEVPGRPLDYPRMPRRGASYAATWGPSLVAPLAATAHLTHLARPSESTTLATRLLDAAVAGLGVAGLARELTRQQRGRTPSVASLALASAGLFGLLLDRQERQAHQERRQLERRARVVERLVPQRRPKLDRVVIHV